ncbi:hypothetical protein WMY93_015711 [Mugilogobius chulae]|uniref:Checkpoint suppressor 1 n=1 Tax=Mugilogobius chulae TaxID=88201 RepID=A0AAW0NQX1_9GOBI
MPLEPRESHFTCSHPNKSSLGDYLSRGQDSPLRYSPPLCGEDLQEDHTYSTAKSPAQPGAPSSPLSDDIIAVEIQEDIKQEPREIPLDPHLTSAAAYITQNALRGQRRNSSTGSGVIASVGAGTLAGSSLPWTKSKARGISDTLPLKKRRAAAALEKPESDDEEMKEAAGSLLHLAGVRACLNNITNRAAKGQKEQKEQKETLRN